MKKSEKVKILLVKYRTGGYWGILIPLKRLYLARFTNKPDIVWGCLQESADILKKLHYDYEEDFILSSVDIIDSLEFDKQNIVINTKKRETK